MRKLTKPETELWRHVTASVVRRRKPRERIDPVETEPPPKRAVKTAPPAASPVQKLPPPEKSARQLDGKRAARLRKGDLAIEARIDLHGLTLDLAHKALAGFLAQARHRKHRLLLVITGKTGELNRLVPLWLTTPPFAPGIVTTERAAPHHGGGGAYYVYLRRARP